APAAGNPRLRVDEQLPLAQHRARLRGVDQGTRVLGQQELLLQRTRRCGAHALDVAFVRAVALFERRARVVAGLAFGRAARERDHAADVVADLPLMERHRTTGTPPRSLPSASTLGAIIISVRLMRGGAWATTPEPSCGLNCGPQS